MVFLQTFFLLLGLFARKPSCFCEHIVVSCVSRTNKEKNLSINDSLSVFHLLYELPVGRSFLSFFFPFIHFWRYFLKVAKKVSLAFYFSIFERKNAFISSKNLFFIISLFWDIWQSKTVLANFQWKTFVNRLYDNSYQRLIKLQGEAKWPTTFVSSITHAEEKKWRHAVSFKLKIKFISQGCTENNE